MPLPEDALLEAAARLTKDADVRAIESVLHRLSAEPLSLLAKRRILDEIKRRTGYGVTELAAEMRIHQRGLPQNRRPGWMADLVVNKTTGEPLPLAVNVLTALRGDRQWHGVLGFDVFHQQPYILARPPWANGEWREPRPFTDTDEDNAVIWAQNAGIHCRSDQVRTALSVACNDNPFHPVRDYLDRLKWDGVERLANAPNYYFGVARIPNYTELVFLRWMISAVARIYQPGCMAKYCLILEGPQDLNKSKALEALGEPWFTDDIASLGSKDSAMQIGNAWIVELAELDSLQRAEISAAKAFISRKVDQFRKPYGRHVVRQERQCVLAGTVNPSGNYLFDETGNVRFWPLICTSIDIDTLKADRDQLWAEAVHRYRQHEPWHIDEEEAIPVIRHEQDKRAVEDSWLDIISDYLRKNVQPRNEYGEPDLNFGAVWVTSYEILNSCLGIDAGRITRADEMKVARCLRRVGWERYRDTQKDRRKPDFIGRPWRYRPTS